MYNTESEVNCMYGTVTYALPNWDIGKTYMSEQLMCTCTQAIII